MAGADEAVPEWVPEEGSDARSGSALPGGQRVIVVTGTLLSPADVVAVARYRMRVALGTGVRERLEAERAVVLAALDRGDAVYGLTTGLGARATHRLDAAELAEFSARTVRGRATAVGPPLPVETVRATLLARVNSMAHGGSGVTPGIVDLLVAMLNRGVHPRIPGTGSIGASDLCQLAHVALVVMGEGVASYAGPAVGGVEEGVASPVGVMRGDVGEGRVGSGAEVLGWAGLQPVALGPKDGLALCSANSVAAGTAALAVAAVEDLHLLAHAVAATSLEGFRANTSPLDARVHAARPAPGQGGSADLLRRLLAGGLLLGPGSGRRLQDPISFRAVAQVHGALRSALDFTIPALDADLNGSADNPLVLELANRGGELISTGNFHSPGLALALDTLALAMCQVGALSTARVQRLLSARISGLPANLAPEGLGRTGFAAVVKTAQALLAEMRHLGGPTSIDPRAGAEDVEDDSTNAPLGAARVAAIAERLRLLLAIEALVATQAVELAAPSRLGRGATMLSHAVRFRVASLVDDRPCGPDIERIAEEVLTADLAGRFRSLPSARP